MVYKVIFLDAGHSTSTSGKETHVFSDTNKRMKEREFNDSVVIKMIDMLNEYDIDEIMYVSNTDTPEVSLEARVKLANDRYDKLIAIYGKNNVFGVFLSIHANHDGGKIWSQANGIETYHYASTNIGGDTLANIVQSKLIHATGLKDRGVKTSEFYVLKNTKMGAILTENGFMSNLDEAKLLRSDEYRLNIAKATTDGIVEYMGLNKNIGNVIDDDVKVDTNVFYRIVCGSFNNREIAKKEEERLKQMGLNPFIVKYVRE